MGALASFLERAWTDLEPTATADEFEATRTEAHSLVDAYVDRDAYTPAVAPENLTVMGYEDGTVREFQTPFATFNSRDFKFATLVPLYAATLDVLGELHVLMFP